MKKETVIRRKHRVRAKIFGTKLRPRVSVYRSNKSLFVQLIDDENKKTIIGLSERQIKTESKLSNSEKSKQLGIIAADLAKKKKITKAVFDKGIYAYHGRVKALAEGLRQGGLKF